MLSDVTQWWQLSDNEDANWGGGVRGGIVHATGMWYLGDN